MPIDIRSLSPEEIMAMKESLYRRSLYDFARAAWPTIDPAPFIGGGFAMQAVCEHLEACAKGGIRNLIINVPPRFSKSTLTGTLFPAWCWAQKGEGPLYGPGIQFLFASYSQNLALQDSIKCRRLVESDWYRQFWGHKVIISSDQNTKSQFDLVGGGRRNTVSVGGSTTGMGGNCFVAGTRVLTPTGYAQIEQMRIGDEVLAFDHERGLVVKSSVIATKSSIRSDLYEIHTSEGHKFICTGDHPIFCEGQGYIAASKLGEGSKVLLNSEWIGENQPDVRLVRQGPSEAYLRATQSIKQGIRGLVLLPQMLVKSSCGQKLSSQVLKLRQAYEGSAFQILLGRLQVFGSAGKKAKDILRGVWNRVYQEGQQTVLQPRLCKQSALAEYVRSTKLKFHGQRQIWQPVYADGGIDPTEGQSFLLGMRNARHVGKTFQRTETVNTASASHGRQSDAQHAGQSDNPVHELPQEAPSWHIGTIKSARAIGGEPQSVYDIQVAGFSNFFAEGLLVHNCLIADDPNNAREANSEAVLESTIEWWDMAWSTRLNDPKTGCRIVIQQRLSEQDITGHILEKDVGHWTHLCLPMKFEPERRTYNVLMPEYEDEEGYYHEEKVWTDPRTEPGELLWEQRFGEDEVDLLERTLGPWAAAGQLQQRPEPKGGGIIKRDWWQLWEGETFPTIEYMVAALDTAYTEKTENDFSAMTVWGVFRGGDEKAQVTRSISADGTISSSVTRTYQEDQRPKVILMYAWQKRLELHDLVKEVQETMRRYKIEKLLIENKATGIPVASELRRLYGYEDFVVQLVDPRGQLRNYDKVSRVHSIVPIFADGLVYAPDRSWADMLITQMTNFPKGKFDDLVDTTVYALRHLREIGYLVRGDEWTADVEDKMQFTGNTHTPLYAV